MYHLMRLLIPRTLLSGSTINPQVSRLIVLPVAVLALLGVACAAAATPTPAPEATAIPSPTPTAASKIKVVATTTILTDMAKNVGGNLIEVSSILPPGVDVHSFQTTPSHSIALGQAAVIISNGFGLDSFLDPVLASAQQSTAIHVIAAEGLAAEPLEESVFPEEPEGVEHPGDDLVEDVEQLIHQAEEGEITAEESIELIEQMLGGRQHEADARAGEGHSEGDESLEEGLMELVHETEEGHMTPESAIEAMEELVGEYEGEEHGHGHEAGDPHFWQDPTQAIHYVERIRNGLVQADPANAQVYSSNADRYIQELRELDQEIAQTLSQVPPEHRHLVTFHDAFGYFARRYGWKFSAFVPGDASDVTPGAVTQVMERVRAEGIPAVFAEPQFSADVLEQAARDTGVRVGIIYSDTIDDKVLSYIEMMRFNSQSLVENLR